LNDLQENADLAIAKLVNDPAVLHCEGHTGDTSTQGFILSGHIKLTQSDFPVPLIVSSPHLKNKHVVSAPGHVGQRGIIVILPGQKGYAPEEEPVCGHLKDVKTSIAKDFLHVNPEDADRGVTFIEDGGVKTHAQLTKENPLVSIIRESQATNDGLAYEIKKHLSKRGGILVEHNVFEEARKCFMNKIAPHLIKQDLSEITFNLERAGADWGDSLSPELSDPRFRKTTYSATLQLCLRYKLIPNK
jgi:hypothetical protein